MCDWNRTSVLSDTSAFVACRDMVSAPFLKIQSVLCECQRVTSADELLVVLQCHGSRHHSAGGAR